MENLHFRFQLARLIPLNGRAVELGVAAGTFSAALLSTKPGFTLFSVDSWADDERGHGEQEHAECARLLARYGARSVIMRRTFQEAVRFFPDASLDFVYVDGYAHTGQDNGRTLRDWWPKVKAGGVFAGHDYHPQWPETVRAVDQFTSDLGRRFKLTAMDQFPSWWLRK